VKKLSIDLDLSDFSDKVSIPVPLGSNDDPDMGENSSLLVNGEVAGAII
jgi:hypothetical protein